MADTVNRVGIEIDAKSTGGAGLREQIANINDLKDVSSRFMAIQSAGAEKYPDSLKKQNQYYKEQIDLVKQLETSASKDRLDALKGERDDIIKRQQRSGTEHERQALIVEKNQVLQNLYNEEQVREHASREDVRARRDRTAWAREQGLGAYGDKPEGPGFERDMMTRLAAGDLGGVAQAGVGRGMAGMATRFGGMSTMAKLGLGAGAGVLGLGAYKLISGLAEGWTEYKDMAPEILNLKTMSANMGDSGGLRETLTTGMASTGTKSQDFIGLMKAWQRGGGLSTMVGQDADDLAKTINLAQSYGIDKSAGVEFTAQMARTGTEIGRMDETKLRRTIQEGLVAGIEVSRLPEYLDQVSQVTDAVLQTAVAFNPDVLAAQISSIASLGLPFQGERGTQFITGMQGALTDSGGIGFEAARQIAEERFGSDYELFDIMRIQQKGMADPDMLKKYLSISEQVAGGDRKDQAAFLSLQTGLPVEYFLNPDKDINSLIEGEIRTKAVTPKTYEDVPGAAGPYFGDQRVAEMQATEASKRARADAMTDAIAINTSAALFSSASDLFNQAVIDFATAVGSERISTLVPVNTSPDAVARRQAKKSVEQRAIDKAPDVMMGF